MTQENKETEFDIRQVTDDTLRHTDKHILNSMYGKISVRPMVQFVPGKQDTTEMRLKDIRERMTFTKARNTIRRTGWYFTESYTPCGEGLEETAQQSIKNMFGV